MGLCRVVLSRDIPNEWESIRPHLEKAIAKGDGSIDIYSTYWGLIDGTHYAIRFPEGAGTVINCVSDEGERVLLIGLLGAEDFRPYLADFAATVIALAAWLDIGIIELQGRKGWARYLKHLAPTIEGERIRFYVK